MKRALMTMLLIAACDEPTPEQRAQELRNRRVDFARNLQQQLRGSVPGAWVAAEGNALVISAKGCTKQMLIDTMRTSPKTRALFDELELTMFACGGGGGESISKPWP